MRRAMMKAAGGGGPYPAGTILAYEFNETTGPAVDAINGYEAALGATMSIGGGVMSTSNTDAITDRAPSDDTTLYLEAGVPATFEIDIDINSAGAIPAIFALLQTIGNCGFYASNINATYQTFIMRCTAVLGSQSVLFAGPAYSLKPYHLVLTYDGGVIPASFNLFIDGVKTAGIAGGGLGASANLNAFGWLAGTTNGAIDYNYFRIRNYEVSDAEAAQMYADR